MTDADAVSVNAKSTYAAAAEMVAVPLVVNPFIPVKATLSVTVPIANDESCVPFRS